MTVTREQIIGEAMSWIGTPFVHDGRVKGVGVDCARLVEMTAKACGLYEDVVIPPYSFNPDTKKMHALLRQHLDEIAFRDLSVGDVLWFRVVHDPQHLGIVVETEPLTIIHSLNQRRRGGVVLTRVFGLWRERIAGCFRLRGVV